MAPDCYHFISTSAGFLCIFSYSAILVAHGTFSFSSFQSASHKDSAVFGVSLLIFYMLPPSSSNSSKRSSSSSEISLTCCYMMFNLVYDQFKIRGWRSWKQFSLTLRCGLVCPLNLYAFTPKVWPLLRF
eukprot:TRINITY_DN842_c0_g1_i1.p4 TRINITY_DN842_c0_g1~~TRINITY_DN842_c0_g1_i1.p4  ORF type:complete len:129 (-),score=2.26 TRINITY_DN842_c0_g1_i1:16-402(-)